MSGLELLGCKTGHKKTNPVLCQKEKTVTRVKGHKLLSKMFSEVINEGKVLLVFSQTSTYGGPERSQRVS